MESGKVRGMNCDEFWNGEPQALDHLKECRECAARFDRQERLAAGLRQLGAQTRHLQAPSSVERQVVAGFRGRAEFARMPRPGSLWWTVGAWAAGLAVTIGIAMLLAGGRQPESTERIRRHATQLAVVEVPAVVEEGEFIPLPNAESIAPNEAVNLVRIEAPRSALVALGLAVDADRPDEPVEAEVMLGADGVARAIRFLD